MFNGGPRGKRPEKSKDFSGAMKRLFSELKIFKTVVSIAIIAAIIGSVLAVIIPNRLSDLTDAVADGIKPNSQSLDELKQVIQEDTAIIQKATLAGQPPVFKSKVIGGEEISPEDQMKLLEIMQELGKKADTQALYSRYNDFPESIKKAVEPKMDIDAVWGIALFIIALRLISSLLDLIEGLSMAYVTNKFAQSLRDRISKKINKLPLRYFDKHRTGDVLSRVTNDIDTMAQAMNQSLSSLVAAVTLLIGSIIMMTVTNWVMALTAILASLFGFTFAAFILSKSQKYFEARQVELGKLNSHIEEVYSGLNVVKVYNGSKEMDEKFHKRNQAVYEANMKGQFLSGLMHPMMAFVGNLGYVAVCIVGALLTMNGVISFGVIIAFTIYVRMFTSPLTDIAQGLTSLQSVAAASERVFEFVDEEEMDDQRNAKEYLDKKDAKGNIVFDHVKFGYEPGQTIIKDFSAKVKPGQKIAIVGPTGAGKTTMVNLLMKFYEIESGNIEIDGHSTKDLTRENIHSLFTMVLQDTWMFSGTIRENLTYNNENISDSKLMKICETVGLKHFIKTLPNELDTDISENESVSAGQRQLITIARGMVEDAPFLILDEATSNVDTRTEELVQKAMDKLMEGRTSFIIAHRLSTIKNADLILVMNHGNIIESGTHSELLAQNGAYAELYNSQFQDM